MKSHNILGLIGFIFSAIAAILGATIFGALYGFISWGISILIRSIAWILLSKEIGKVLYLITGIIVLIFGILSISSLFIVINPNIFRLEIKIPIQVPVILWSIYSFLEFLSYISTKGRIFKIAAVNIVSIIIMNLAIAPIRDPEEIQEFGLLIISGAFIIMAISAIAASIGFSKISRS
jgi:hypothetical protein